MTAPIDHDFTDENIAEYLRGNPDFLNRHPEILATLDLSSQSGNVVDFQQMMVAKLRQDKQRSEDRQRTLVTNARSNMIVQARVHAAVVRLLEARNLDELAEIVASELSIMLEVDVVALCLESPSFMEIANTNGIRNLPAQTIDQYMGDRDALLEANIAGDANLFGPAARLVKSQALLRLHIADNIPDGLLAFGSRDPLLFADSQGTELIGFLGDVIERLLRHFLGHVGY